jgi:DNA replication protein DnaC
MKRSDDDKATLLSHLKELHLPTICSCFDELARQAEQETLSYERFLLALVERELQVRRQLRLERQLRDSRLPMDKDLTSFDMKRLPAKLAKQVKSLLDGSFVDRRENLLAFGTVGGGKTHLLCGIAHCKRQLKNVAPGRVPTVGSRTWCPGLPQL